MYHTHSRCRPAHRRGAILLVVLVLLALFAVIGLSFVFYAESRATASRIGREAQAHTIDQPPDSDVAVNEFLRQVLYPIHPFNPQTTPTPDPTIPQAGNEFNPDVRSALYGHDMARLVYGYRYADPDGNIIPYNGLGIFPEDISAAGIGITDRREVINHSHRPGLPMIDPEYTGFRTDPKTAPAGVYVSKNAPYTYPDRNNVAVALVDPNTGQVIIPSYHRPNLFNATQPTIGLRLAPPGVNGVPAASDDWLTPAGRYRILRPRPADHDPDGAGALVSEFPYPTPNADGTYTGDVQNMVYANGVQKHDSVWLDFNGPVYDWRGRRIKPLIAALVVPLDGRINLNVAGNLPASATALSSNMGFGPWEQNLKHVLSNPATADLIATQIIQNRNNSVIPAPSPRGTTVTARAFHPDPTNPAYQTQPQGYALVDWNAFGATIPPYLPGMDPALAPGLKFGSSPTYAPLSPTVTGYDNSDLTAEQTNHPSLYTPYFWDPFKMSTTGQVGTFPLFDTMRLAGRYSDKASNYSGYSFLGSKFVPEFAGTAPASGGPNDPLRLTRVLTTVASNSLNRPGVAPNYLDPATTNYQLAPGAQIPTLAAPPTLALTPPPGGPTTDILDPTIGISNQRMMLSGVDLNRPLADYRDPTTRPALATDPWPMNPTTVTVFQANLAWTDRQSLAKSIYVRMVIATGAKARIDPTSGYPIPDAATPEQLNALRWLAQLSANMVDYIDNDDVNTPFVWNPTTPADPLAMASADFDPAQMPNRVVFGVEKPRLVINEVYAEVANDPADKGLPMATKDFQVRFFLELLNPNNTESNLQSALVGPDPTNPGSVPLRYTTAGGFPADISVYQIQVFDNASPTTGIVGDLGPNNPQNVTGSAITPLLTPKIICDFVNTADPTRNVVVPTGSTVSPEWVEPNNGNFMIAAARQGFAVIGPQLDPAQADTISFVPDTAAAPFNMILQKPNDTVNVANPNQLVYTVPKANDGDIPANVMTPLNANKHAVLLQRLACPYLPPDPTNPYITVDYTSQVQVHDAIAVAGDQARGTPPTPANNWSIGRVQPYAGYQDPTADVSLPTTTWQQTLTLRQQPTTPLTTAQHSFFQQNAQTTDPTTLPPNGDLTLRTPFEWLTHLDRRLVNRAELLHVSATKPHELTHRFATKVDPADTTAVRPYFHMHDLRVPYGTTIPGKTPGGPLFPPTGVYSPLYRALAMLDVNPWGHGLPEGGRVPGKVNINMLWDEQPTLADPTVSRSRVFDAIMDKQAANSFTEQDLTTIWNAIKASRSPQWTAGNPPVVGATLDETGIAGSDRPFKSFGAAMFGIDPITATDIRDTILRPRPTPDADLVTRSLFARTGTDPLNPLHPYQSAEPLRKAMNSFTTVSDTYVVIMTVGYFEVRNVGPYGEANPPILGKEVYDEMPGDMRYKYSAVIDRTRLNLELDATGTITLNPLFAGGGNQAAQWTTELATPAVAGETVLRFPATGVDATSTAIQMNYEGIAYQIVAGTGAQSQLRIGTGANSETVIVSAVGGFDSTTGLATVTIAAPGVAKSHFVGEAVSNNVVNGNPGPQPRFDIRQPMSPYTNVVPRLDRITTTP